MTFPENLKYSKEHTWLAISGDTGRIGITEFAQRELGEIVYVDMPRVGQSFKKDEAFGSVEAIKTTSDLFMPVGGTVKRINEIVVKKPAPVNTDSYNEGWLIEIQIANPTEANDLLSAIDYKTIIGQH